MIYIGICDDQEIYRQLLRELCEQYFQNHPCEYEYVEFASGEELLQFKTHKLHLLFLDIELGNMNGIEVLSQLESEKIIWRVVFITCHQDQIYHAFGLKTLGFEVKPPKYERVEKWLTVALRENQENEVYESIVNGEKKYFVMEDIYYLKADGNYTYICMKDNEYLVGDRLNIWMERMKQAPIVRIHKSYMVNLLHVKRWDVKKVILMNDAELTIGRQYRSTAKERYREFIGRFRRDRLDCL